MKRVKFYKTRNSSQQYIPAAFLAIFPYPHINEAQRESRSYSHANKAATKRGQGNQPGISRGAATLGGLVINNDQALGAGAAFASILLAIRANRTSQS